MRPTEPSPGTSPRKRQGLRVLFTCVGRRVELLSAFRRAAKRLRIRLTVLGADAGELSPGLHLVDQPHLVPTIASGAYIDALLKLVRKEKVDLLVPLLDLELPLLAEAADRFADLGCCALISAPSVIRTCRDKMATYRALTKAGLDTPATWPWRELSKRKRHRFPYYLKPRRGSAAVGNFVVRNRDELMTFGRRVPDAIVQEYVEGSEYTLDVYTGFDGEPRCAVPRKRLEVRSGEVSKALIVKDPAVMTIGCEVARALPGCRGVITVQCMVTAEGRICVIEINPRFGGGVPLAIHAGADFPRWIMAELVGKKPRISPNGFRDGVAMLRFDESVFVQTPGAKLRPTKRRAVRVRRTIVGHRFSTGTDA